MENITITLSAQNLRVIGAALQELPYKLSKPVIDEIDKQVRDYLASKAHEPTPRPSSEP